MGIKTKVADNLKKHALMNSSFLEAPGSPSEEAIRLQLYPHQEQAFSWLVQREANEELPPLWEETTDGSFLNLYTQEVREQRPKPLRGGIFGDASGLGKTLPLLSLMSADKSLINGSAPPGTLVVCVDVEDWIGQLEMSTCPGAFKFSDVREYDDLEMQQKDVEYDDLELQQKDVVLTTYKALCKKDKITLALKKVRWRRVILDDAHHISQMKDWEKRLILGLKATRRWQVSGRTDQDSSLGLIAMEFLNFEPALASVRSWGKWTKLFRVEDALATIILRRATDILHLPPRSLDRVIVEQTLQERDQEFFFKTEKDNMGGRLHPQHRLCCSDSTLFPSNLNYCLPSSITKDVSGEAGLAEKLTQSRDDECNICLHPSRVNMAVITQCGHHPYCRPCIWRAIKAKPMSDCPECRASISTLYALPEDMEAAATTVSSKAAYLLAQLQEIRQINPLAKSVIFSQFYKSLKNLERVLQERGFRPVILRAEMTRRQKRAILAMFAAVGEAAPPVMLATGFKKAKGERINLTAARRVFFLEPFAVHCDEQYSASFVHQIGQRQPVIVSLLVAQNTLEEDA